MSTKNTNSIKELTSEEIDDVSGGWGHWFKKKSYKRRRNKNCCFKWRNPCKRPGPGPGPGPDPVGP